MIDEKELGAAVGTGGRKPIGASLNLPSPLPLIDHAINGTVVSQRPRDGYINATALCKKAGKMFGHYHENKQTRAFLAELAADIGIPISALIQSVKGGNDAKMQGTWVHPQVAINLGQWLSPRFSVLVSKWVFEWMRGDVSGFMPVHVRRYIKNRAKIPLGYFSMLNEIYLNLVAPMEDGGYVMPDKMMPDISTGRMFSAFLREKGLAPEEFPTYEHEFADDSRPTVHARLYPLKYLEDFRRFFNDKWLPKRAISYFKEKDPGALAHVRAIQKLPAPPASNR